MVTHKRGSPGTDTSSQTLSSLQVRCQIFSVLFRRFFGNSKQIFVDMLSRRKILDDLDRKMTELGQFSGLDSLLWPGYCLKFLKF